MPLKPGMVHCARCGPRTARKGEYTSPALICRRWVNVEIQDTMDKCRVILTEIVTVIHENQAEHERRIRNIEKGQVGVWFDHSNVELSTTIWGKNCDYHQKLVEIFRKATDYYDDSDYRESYESESEGEGEDGTPDVVCISDGEENDGGSGAEGHGGVENSHNSDDGTLSSMDFPNISLLSPEIEKEGSEPLPNVFILPPADQSSTGDLLKFLWESVLEIQENQ